MESKRLPNGLTPRQNEAYLLIYGFIKDHGFSPTLRDLASELGVNNPSGVICHINALEKRGFISSDSVARGIRLIMTDGMTCPFCNSLVGAGNGRDSVGSV